MFYPTTKAMLDLANSLKALKAYQGLVSFPDLRPRGPRGPLGSLAGGHRDSLNISIERGLYLN